MNHDHDRPLPRTEVCPRLEQLLQQHKLHVIEIHSGLSKPWAEDCVYREDVLRSVLPRQPSPSRHCQDSERRAGWVECFRCIAFVHNSTEEISNRWIFAQQRTKNHAVILIMLIKISSGSTLQNRGAEQSALQQGAGDVTRLRVGTTTGATC